MGPGDSADVDERASKDRQVEHRLDVADEQGFVSS